MASRVVTQLISDLSGDEISGGGGETIEFAYRGTNYTIDLTAKEAAGFDKAIAVYVEHAASTRGGGRRAAASKGTGNDPKAVRAWAKDQGLSIPERGRIPGEIQEKYRAAH